jgi:5'-nucleotidase/UDP-sugar diphosphatase
MYRFSTSDFVLNGGDGYAVLSRSEQVYNTSLLLSTVFMETIQARGAITPVVEGRITVIP